MATLELTVYDSWSVTDDAQESCAPLVWNDVLLSSSGTYTYEGSTAFGCDSVVTIGFTLLEGTSSSTLASACDDYVWNDSLYTTSGTYDWQGTNVEGCDSVATLELTVYDSWSVTDADQESCTPLVWNDVLLSSSGTYTYEGSTAFGCDSVVTIGFTLLEGTSSSTSASACDGYVWNDSLYTTSGTYGTSKVATIGKERTSKVCDSGGDRLLSLRRRPLPAIYVWTTLYTTSGTWSERRRTLELTLDSWSVG